ncbi:helix-turn-helix domain-containing protein [Niabella sp. CC-SYL272]|uniref:helix-turn-helix domain-containing protein n=1 Tax=Niabella agricola TaxID=2891571 RepID=UPI001F1D545D|nr:helix-turn-helix domain-containing protein [Niabella agricola]MCF3107303.1 helix-turn-helix domain-containing protein [Niabella agricola]
MAKTTGKAGAKKTKKSGSEEQEIPTYHIRIMELIDERRAITGETDTAVFADLGYVQSSISPLRLNRQFFPTSKIIAAKKLFGVSYDWIFGETDHRDTVIVPVNATLQALVKEAVQKELKIYFSGKK